MLLTFAPLELSDMPQILEERNKVPETLRTPYALNSVMQEQYFRDVLSNRNSSTRYFKFLDDNEMIGMGGIEHISWENRIGELSILIFEEARGKGYGKQLVGSILYHAFDFLNLENVFAECYFCGQIGFWAKIIEITKAYNTMLPARKYYDGRFWDSMYINFNRQREHEGCKKLLSQAGLEQSGKSSPNFLQTISI
jgi:GNAT superfamily N-acetyltransferase